MSELDQPITEAEYKLALLVIKRQYPNAAIVIEEYVKQLNADHSSAEEAIRNAMRNQGW